MPSQHRNPSQRQNVMRRNIASLAARMMAEDGIADYGFAKRKAARQLGVPDTEALPTNAEIEAELRVYQSLYQGEEQEDRLFELRSVALEVMRLLEPFHPYLTGPVLDGTAARFAEVEIEVFPDSPKEVEMFLLNRRIAFEQAAPRRNGGEPAEATLHFEWHDAPVRLTVFPATAERSVKRNPRSGRISERAKIGAVEALLKKKAGDDY
ncbi:MAG: hypothetical protein AB1768_16340 [Pseudomonadota bacterium]|jgi:hypothetical protein